MSTLFRLTLAATVAGLLLQFPGKSVAPSAARQSLYPGQSAGQRHALTRDASPKQARFHGASGQQTQRPA
jgi:hypothetical protein